MTRRQYTAIHFITTSNDRSSSLTRLPHLDTDNGRNHSYVNISDTEVEIISNYQIGKSKKIP